MMPPVTPASPIFVHVGLPKTATTALQNHVFPCLAGVDYLGAKGTRWPDERGIRAARRVLRALKFNSREILGADRLPGELADAAAHIAASPRPVLLSDETLATNAMQLDHDRVPLVPQALRRLFGERAQAILVLREPVAFIASLLLQRTWSHPNQPARSDGRPDWPRPGRILDAHLAAAAGGDPRSIFGSATRYDAILHAYRSALGEAATHVLAYERLFDEAGRCRPELPAILGSAPPAEPPPRENASTDAKRADMARRWLGPAVTEPEIARCVAAWSGLRERLAADPRVRSHVAAHCAAPYAAAVGR